MIHPSTFLSRALLADAIFSGVSAVGLTLGAGLLAPLFNLSEAFSTGARSDTDLARKLETQYFGSIALTSMSDFMLGPHLKSVLLAHYRVAHEDDNGVFLERR